MGKIWPVHHGAERAGPPAAPRRAARCARRRKLTGLGISGELPAELSLMSALNAMYLGNNRCAAPSRAALCCAVLVCAVPC